MSEQQDYYGLRLAAVSETNPVIANENICNDQGVLLLAKGSQLTQSRAELIVQHRLIKPLEHSVDVSQSLDAKGLYALLLKFTEHLPGLKATFFAQSETQEIVKSLCLFYEKFPLLRQKLTVFANQLPQLYYHSLFAAGAGAVLATHLGLEKNDLRAVFIGALMHNTGFLHLDPKLTLNEMELEDDDSVALQAHPIIAQRFLQQVPGLPAEVALAVGDHHERTDGSGYPHSKFGRELSLPSQVIAMCDTMVEAYHRCAPYEEHSHRLILRILQLNDNVHFDRVYRATAVLYQLGPMVTTPPKHLPNPTHLRQQLTTFNRTFVRAKKLALVLMTSTKPIVSRPIGSMVGRLAISIARAGLNCESFCAWLSEMENGMTTRDNEELINLMESEVMLDEIERQLQRLKIIMWKVIKAIYDENPGFGENLIVSYNEINKAEG